jgi:putative NADPH-quinone reductase
MGRRITVIQGHPDPSANRFGHALASAYMSGAREGGHEVVGVDVAGLDFPLLRSKEDFEHGAPPEAIRRAQQAIEGAEHLVFIYPLWLGTMPALLKAFLEQVFRPGFAMERPDEAGIRWKRRLMGKSARIVVTMGMPAFIYRWYFRAHSLKSLERNILGFCGISPIKETLIGTVESANPAAREKWLARLHRFGREGR